MVRKKYLRENKTGNEGQGGMGIPEHKLRKYLQTLKDDEKAYAEAMTLKTNKNKKAAHIDITHKPAPAREMGPRPIEGFEARRARIEASRRARRRVISCRICCSMSRALFPPTYALGHSMSERRFSEIIAEFRALSGDKDLSTFVRQKYEEHDRKVASGEITLKRRRRKKEKSKAPYIIGKQKEEHLLNKY